MHTSPSTARQAPARSGPTRTNAGLNAALAIAVLATAGVSNAASREELVTLLNPQINASTRFENNVGFAPDSPSKRNELTTRVEGALRWNAIATTTQEVAFGVAGFYDYAANLTDLSNSGGRISASFRQQLNADFTSPWIGFKSEGTWLEHLDSDLRDGYKVETELAGGKQFNPRFGVTVGARLFYRRSREDNPEGTLAGRNSDEVFDLKQHGGFIKVDINLLPRTNAFVEYAYMTGDVAATGDGGAFNEPQAFDSARDFAFEEGVRFQAWRIDADQDVYTVGVDHAFTDQISANVKVRYIGASGEFANDYENASIEAGVSYSLR